MGLVVSSGKWFYISKNYMIKQNEKIFNRDISLDRD